MRIYFFLSILLLLVAFSGCDKEAFVNFIPSGIAPPEKPLHTVRIACRLADRLPYIHLNRKPFDDRIATNALALFVDALDYDRTVFLSSDIAEFQRQATQLDDQVSVGDISFAQTIFTRFEERVTNRVAYVYTLLDQGFDLERDETYQWKRNDAPWAANEKEWNDLWRKKIKNDYVSRVAAKQVAEQEMAKATHTVQRVEENSLTNTTEVVENQTKLFTPDEFVRERYKQYQLLIQNNYDQELILQRYLSAFTHSYDPHSDYLSPRSVEDFDINMKLSLVGIGAILRSEDGTAKIQSIIPGGPADRDGRLQPGDKIIAVAQGTNEAVSIMHWPLGRAVRLIRGKKDTPVILSIIPAKDTTGVQIKPIDLIRDKVKLEEQAAKGDIRELEQSDGTIRRFGTLTLPEFYADFEAVRKGKKEARRASTDVQRILKEFSTNHLDGVILDLRNNGGGSLSEAIEIAGFFIPTGPVVQVREQRGVLVLPDRDPSTQYSGPLIVLVNRLSASASEIVAAALQDYGRAVIVGGSKTHGKGTVQTVFPLSRVSDGLGSLKVTTAGFYRIVGGSTQLKGVIPDIILPSVYDALEIGEDSFSNALPWSRVRSTLYRPWRQSVKAFIPTLQKQSEARIANNQEFKLLLAQQNRIRKRMKTPAISLKLSDRIEDIVTEKELENIQDDVVDRNDEKKKDPVLDETFRIFCDLTDCIQPRSTIEISGLEH